MESIERVVWRGLRAWVGWKVRKGCWKIESAVVISPVPWEIRPVR